MPALGCFLQSYQLLFCILAFVYFPLLGGQIWVQDCPLEAGLPFLVLFLERPFQTTTNLLYLVLLGCFSSSILFLKRLYNLPHNLLRILVIATISGVINSRNPPCYWSLWIFTFGSFWEKVVFACFTRCVAWQVPLGTWKGPAGSQGTKSVCKYKSSGNEAMMLPPEFAEPCLTPKPTWQISKKQKDLIQFDPPP